MTNPIIPKKSIATTSLTIIIAIMSAFATLTICGTIIVNDNVRTWKNQIVNEVTIQIINDNQTDTDTENTINEVTKSVRGVRGVVSAEVISLEQTKKLIEPWFGENFDVTQLPVPRLVAIKINEQQFDVSELKRSISHIKNATVDDHQKWSERLKVTANVVSVSGGVIFALVMIATILTIIFATRGAIDSNAHIIEVLHFVGASPKYIASQFQKRFVNIALKGAVVGSVIAVSGVIPISVVVSQTVGTKTIISNLYIYMSIVGIIIIITMLAAVTSQKTVVKYIQAIKPK